MCLFTSAKVSLPDGSYCKRFRIPRLHTFNAIPVLFIPKLMRKSCAKFHCDSPKLDFYWNIAFMIQEIYCDHYNQMQTSVSIFFRIFDIVLNLDFSIFSNAKSWSCSNIVFLRFFTSPAGPFTKIHPDAAPSMKEIMVIITKTSRSINLPIIMTSSNKFLQLILLKLWNIVFLHKTDFTLRCGMKIPDRYTSAHVI